MVSPKNEQFAKKYQNGSIKVARLPESAHVMDGDTPIRLADSDSHNDGLFFGFGNAGKMVRIRTGFAEPDWCLRRPTI